MELNEKQIAKLKEISETELTINGKTFKINLDKEKLDKFFNSRKIILTDEEIDRISRQINEF